MWESAPPEGIPARTGCLVGLRPGAKGTALRRSNLQPPRKLEDTGIARRGDAVERGEESGAWRLCRGRLGSERQENFGPETVRYRRRCHVYRIVPRLWHLARADGLAGDPNPSIVQPPREETASRLPMAGCSPASSVLACPMERADAG